MSDLLLGMLLEVSMNNGSLKSLLSLWENLARNRRYERFVEEGDISSFLQRASLEGLTFLTRVLPNLGKALDAFHSTSEWIQPESFECDSDGIPIFLGKVIRLALDGNSVAVDCVRQLTLIFYKLEVKHDSEQMAESLRQFINTDEDIGRFDYVTSAPIPGLLGSSGLFGAIHTGDLIKEMRALISRILSNEDPLDIRPCHGSGATACHTPNHAKWHSLRYYPKLDQVYDYSTYFFLSATHVADDLDKLENSLDCEPMARVCLVPKDSRGPRIISCEPAELMYIQQGLMRKLYDALENHPLTRGRLNFVDQSINRNLAREGSVTNLLSTLDLKDASDRVSLNLIRAVFPHDWVVCLEACRSEKTTLPDGVVVELNKFAPMGSSCCFPVEALVFWTCAVATLRLVARASCNELPVKKRFVSTQKITDTWFPDVYVYGDDIICDTAFSSCIIEGLEAIGLLINRSKSYVDGPFRESCGGDYHSGYDVTPVRVRKELSSVNSGLEASADLANEFIAKFGYEESHSLIRVIEEAVGYLYPRTLVDIPMSIRAAGASNDVFFARRWNINLQRFEHRVLQLRYKVLPMREPNWFELLRKELSRGKATARFAYENQLSVAEAHCDPGCYAVDHSAQTKWSWVWLG
jgi:hypothetical protein